jgi:RHS repeat-associated protein
VYDGHGSTRQLVTGTSTLSVTEQYNYDAYGVGLSAPASTLTPYLYTGQQWDSVLRRYYLRARYYDPSNGRFNQLDPYNGNNFDPQSLHKYDYCHGDPVNGVDPSGEFTVWEVLLAVAVLLLVFSITYEIKQSVQNHLEGNPLNKAQQDALADARKFISQNSSPLPKNVQRYLKTALNAEIRTQKDLKVDGKPAWGGTSEFGQIGRGVIQVDEEAFLIDKRLLASILIHEAVHVHQWSLRGESNESAAFKVQSDALRGWGLTANSIGAAQVLFPGTHNGRFVADLILSFEQLGIRNPAWIR